MSALLIVVGLAVGFSWRTTDRIRSYRLAMVVALLMMWGGAATATFGIYTLTH